MSIATEITRLQNAKADIKSAIEAKGVEIPSSATLSNYPEYIETILEGTDVSDTTTISSDVLSGKEFYLSDGTKASGSIPSIGAQTFIPTISNQTIESGKYISGTQTISGDANLIPENIKKNASIFGVTGSYEGSGNLKDDEIIIKLASSTNTSLGRFQCEIKEIQLPKRITTLGDYFIYGHQNLYANLEKIDLTYVRDVGYNAFYYCNKLKEIVMPKNAVVHFYQSFICTPNLKYVDFTHATFNGSHWLGGSDQNKHGGFLFAYCEEENAIEEYGDICGTGSERLKAFVFPNLIHEYARLPFHYCEDLEFLLVPRATNFTCGDGAFRYCYNLKYIFLTSPQLVTSNLTFRDCSNSSNCKIYVSKSEGDIDVSWKWQGCKIIYDCEGIIVPEVTYVISEWYNTDLWKYVPWGYVPQTQNDKVIPSLTFTNLPSGVITNNGGLVMGKVTNPGIYPSTLTISKTGETTKTVSILFNIYAGFSLEFSDRSFAIGKYKSTNIVHNGYVCWNSENERLLFLTSSGWKCIAPNSLYSEYSYEEPDAKSDPVTGDWINDSDYGHLYCTASGNNFIMAWENLGEYSTYKYPGPDKVPGIYTPVTCGTSEVTINGKQVYQNENNVLLYYSNGYWRLSEISNLFNNIQSWNDGTVCNDNSDLKGGTWRDDYSWEDISTPTVKYIYGDDEQTDGMIQVNYKDGQSVPAGGQWSIDSGTTWNDFGSSVSAEFGICEITFQTVSGYAEISKYYVKINSDQTTVLNDIEYLSTVGTLIVNYADGLTPPEGAQWSADKGTTWNDFGSSLTLNVGRALISYKHVDGYRYIPSQYTRINSSETTTVVCSGYAVSAGGVLVEGAGSSDYNGEYELVDSSATGTSRVWKLEKNNNNYYLRYNNSYGKWGITHYTDNDWDDYYMINDSSDDPWGSTWYTNYGSNPAPNVIQN